MILTSRSVPVPFEAADFAAELRQIFLDIAQSADYEPLSGECAPPVDVYETDDVIEIVADLPSVDAARVRVVVKGNAVLIAGEKTPRRSQGDSSFHLVERGYGRFARVVRLGSAWHAGQARAQLRNGELRVTLPKMEERRGRPRHLPISNGPAVA